jgi:hypothetical protein
MNKRYMILAVALTSVLAGCANPSAGFKPSDFGWGCTAERFLGGKAKAQWSDRQVLSAQWFIRVFDFQIDTDDAPALFAKWEKDVEASLRSAGIDFTHNRAQTPNLQLIYWPPRLTGTLHLFLTALPDGKARVTGVVYEYPKDGQPATPPYSEPASRSPQR